jgi:reductive dehalogenase
MPRKRQPISRRDFLRIAGLVGAGVPATNIISFKPKKAEADATLDADGKREKPWWVRTVDHPTVEIDWGQMRRFDARDTVRGRGFAKYVGQVQADLLDDAAARIEQRRMLENVPGYTLKDQALESAQRFDTRASLQFLGPQRAPTPEERGVPRWTGSSQEAAQMLRIAMRHFGAATVGFVKLDERTRKLIYSFDPDGRQLLFEDVEAAYETTDKRVIPDNARWVIVYAVQMSQETMKRAPTVTASQTTTLAYNRAVHIQNRTQEFLRGLGYQCLGEATINALGIAPAFAVMAGLGELSRLNRLITPEYGPMVRVFKMITDLPLPTDQPIDAGIMEFCKRCKKCAEACPPGALSLEDHPSWQVKGGWNNSGHQAYFEDSVRCKTYTREEAGSNCGICFAVCPFSKKDKAWIHNWVKATVSRVPMFDGFFRSMDDAFSYGAKKDPEAWWSLDQPEYGIDADGSGE